MNHWWFEVMDERSENDGEEFLVCADEMSHAFDIAKENFGNYRFRCYGTVSDYWAESSGLDEY